MKSLLTIIIWFSILNMNVQLVNAQVKYEYAEDAIGTVQNSPEIVNKKINLTKGLSQAKSTSLKHSLIAQMNTLYSLPVMNPPKGFYARMGVYTQTPDKFTKLIMPEAELNFGFYYIEKNKETGALRQSQDGTLFNIRINDTRILYDDPFMHEDFEKLKLPVFFEEFAVLDSTEDYIEIGKNNLSDRYDPGNKPMRIIRRNNRPIYVPLTRKEFLEYLIAKKNLDLKRENDIIKDNEKSIAESKKPVSGSENEAIKKALIKSIPVFENVIAKTKVRIADDQDAIDNYRAILNAMPSAESLAPARIDLDKKIPDFDLWKQIVAVGRHEGIGLFKINDKYFDKSSGAPVAQLICVNYKPLYATYLVSKSQIDYLKRKTIDMFYQLDYHKLKESMK